MRKPHQHEQAGKRFDCADPDCRRPFQLRATAEEVLARPENADNRRFYEHNARRLARAKIATREEQYARYLDCGPLAWDDKNNPDC